MRRCAHSAASAVVEPAPQQELQPPIRGRAGARCGDLGRVGAPGEVAQRVLVRQELASGKLGDLGARGRGSRQSPPRRDRPRPRCGSGLVEHGTPMSARGVVSALGGFILLSAWPRNCCSTSAGDPPGSCSATSWRALRLSAARPWKRPTKLRRSSNWTSPSDATTSRKAFSSMAALIVQSSGGITPGSISTTPRGVKVSALRTGRSKPSSSAAVGPATVMGRDWSR